MITPPFNETCTLLFGWQVSPLILGVIALGIGTFLIGCAAIDRTDLRNLIKRVRKLRSQKNNA